MVAEGKPTGSAHSRALMSRRGFSLHSVPCGVPEDPSGAGYEKFK
jgi:hypothetical protein